MREYWRNRLRRQITLRLVAISRVIWLRSRDQPRLRGFDGLLSTRPGCLAGVARLFT